MKNSLFALFALVALLASLGCPPPKHCDVNFGLNESFTLDQAASACLKDGDLSIRFDSVPSDSRCPVGVQCIWAGRADVALTLSQGAATEQVVLASGDMSQGGAGEAAFNGYTVKLQEVAPPKTEGKPIEQKDYKVKLVVSR